MILIEAARRVNHHIKKRKKQQLGKYLSLVRRIERTAPLENNKVVAITFDDGPSAAPPEPNRQGVTTGLTATLLDILNSYGAKGTFDVIGTTEYNYPDIMGKLHTANWGGIKYDHYPDYGNDKLGGIVNLKDIAKRIISEGHELSNHTFKHILFGPMLFIYGKREHFHSLEEVVWDLSQLHKYVKEALGYDMKFSRPPHYIDKITGGYNSYDAYSIAGYNYLAASFDGGGWKSTAGDYKMDVLDMVAPLEKALKADPDALNGQIIFHKDGYNMSHQTPVVDALPRHLELLKQYGYTVVTASKLVDLSPYADVPQTDPIHETLRSLEKTGYCVAYKDNTYQPDRYLTRGELAMMITPPEIIRTHHCKMTKLEEYYAGDINISLNTAFRDVTEKHPYYAGISCSGNIIAPNSRSFNPDKPVDKRDFEAFLNNAASGSNLNWSAKSDGAVKRRDVCDVLLSYIIGKQP